MRKLIIIPIILLFALLVGCTKNVTDQDLSITFQDETITGKYTGELVDNVATSDNATFTYKDGSNYLNYTGSFKDGKFIGTGKLECNFYVVHFKDVDRKGKYSGDVVDGIPKGNGTFSAVNDENEKYTYTGQWNNGLFNGQGKRVFGDNKITYEGTYKDGEFTPTKLEYLQSFNYNSDDKSNLVFNMTDKATDYIKNNDKIFPTSNFEEIKNKVDTNIEFRHLIKNINNYGDKLIKYDKGTVASIYEVNLYGYDITTLQVNNFDGTFYFIYYFGKLNDIYENDNVVVYGLPIACTSFTNVSNTTTQAIVMLGSYVEKR